MKKTILLAYFALFIAFLPPVLSHKLPESPAEATAPPAESAVPAQTPEPTAAPLQAAAAAQAASPAPEKIVVQTAEGITEMDMQEYLVGVVAAEMPASFAPEALKAQAVAARTYALYCAAGNKHQDADVCTDYTCCQAWISDSAMRENWGEDYEANAEKIRAAVAETEGQYLVYEGEPVFAAFHSSSAGATEDCAQVWNPRPYLVSVDSPETAADVPDYISRLECAPLDFRDTILSAYPQADFTGEESEWIGTLKLDTSGRVESAVLGGVEIKGTELRSLFSLRSTAFTLEYTEGRFIFTVTGYGHGVGMSQYGAQVMAQNGEDYTNILAHYYTGTVLVG